MHKIGLFWAEVHLQVSLLSDTRLGDRWFAVASPRVWSISPVASLGWGGSPRLTPSKGVTPE